jgi:hypothetical protein
MKINPMKKMKGRGVCVADGEVLFLDHHVTWVCSLSVRTAHVRGTRWIFGQRYLLSLGAMKDTI